MLVTTGLYAAILAFLLLWLSARVIAVRKAQKISQGSGGNEQLLRRRNAHSNFCEYVPIILILMAAAELSGTSVYAIHLLGIMLVAGRITHSIGMTSEPENFTYRQIGMILTFLSLLLSSLLCLWAWLQSAVLA